MPYFSQSSIKQLVTCHQDLQTLFNEVIKYFDCTVIEGFRGQEAQNKAFADGKTKLKWPNGKHNSYPSNAVDVAPCTNGAIDWTKTSEFYYFGGFVMGIAKMLKAQGKIAHDIRYGGDWDENNNVTDQAFNDLVHFELVL